MVGDQNLSSTSSTKLLLTSECKWIHSGECDTNTRASGLKTSIHIVCVLLRMPPPAQRCCEACVKHQVSPRQERKKGMSGVTSHTLPRSFTASNIWPIDGIKGHHIDDCCRGSSKTSRKKLCNLGNYYSILISKLHVLGALIFPETTWSRLPLYIALLCFSMFLSCFFLLIYPLFGYWKAPQLVIMFIMLCWTFLYKKNRKTFYFRCKLKIMTFNATALWLLQQFSYLEIVNRSSFISVS